MFVMYFQKGKHPYWGHVTDKSWLPVILTFKSNEYIECYLKIMYTIR